MRRGELRGRRSDSAQESHLHPREITNGCKGSWAQHSTPLLGGVQHWKDASGVSGVKGTAVGPALENQDMGFRDLGKSSASSWVGCWTRPHQPCPSQHLKSFPSTPPPTTSCHHLATDYAPWLDIRGLNEVWGPTTTFNPLPRCSLPLCGPGAFILIPPTPPFLSPFFFFF